MGVSLLRKDTAKQNPEHRHCNPANEARHIKLTKWNNDGWKDDVKWCKDGHWVQSNKTQDRVEEDWETGTVEMCFEEYIRQALQTKRAIKIDARFGATVSKRCNADNLFKVTNSNPPNPLVPALTWPNFPVQSNLHLEPALALKEGGGRFWGLVKLMCRQIGTKYSVSLPPLMNQLIVGHGALVANTYVPGQVGVLFKMALSPVPIILIWRCLVLQQQAHDWHTRFEEPLGWHQEVSFHQAALMTCGRIKNKRTHADC